MPDETEPAPDPEPGQSARPKNPRPSDKKYRRREMNTRELAFCNFLLGEARGNKTKAARMAGYRNPASAARRLPHRPEIRRYCEEVLSDHASTDEILELLTRHAFSDITDFHSCWTVKSETIGKDKHGNPITVEAQRFDLVKARRLGLGPLIKKVTSTKSGDQLELHDVQNALSLLGKAAGLWKDKVINENIDLTTLTDEQLARLAKKSQD